MDAFVMRGSKYLVLQFVNGELSKINTCMSEHGVKAIEMQHKRLYSHIEASYVRSIPIDDVIALTNSSEMNDSDAKVLKDMGILL